MLCICELLTVPGLCTAHLGSVDCGTNSLKLTTISRRRVLQFCHTNPQSPPGCILAMIPETIPHMIGMSLDRGRGFDYFVALFVNKSISFTRSGDRATFKGPGCQLRSEDTRLILAKVWTSNILHCRGLIKHRIAIHEIPKPLRL